MAAILATMPAAGSPMQLAIGEGQLVRLQGKAASVAVAKPDVADVRVPVPDALFVFGKAAGRSTVQALAADGRVLATVDLQVGPDLDRLRLLLADLQGARIEVSAVGGSIVLEGEVVSPAQAQAAVAAARQVAGKPEAVLNRLSIAMPTQVNLRVRIAEVSRTLSRELGFSWETFVGLNGTSIGVLTGRDVLTESVPRAVTRSVTGADSLGLFRKTSTSDINTVVDALAEDGLVTLLAEPNLTARSGETASFLSGGEFPIPVSSYRDTVTVEFKQFGVALNFTPTVLDGGRISLKVKPEVSELNAAAGIQINNIRIPGLSVRRAETTVELGSGQSFAIAGLLQAGSGNAVSRLPGLGDLPILGALFRSTRYRRQETELVILVTPYLVQPADSPAAYRLPTDLVRPATDFGSLLLGRLAKGRPLPAGARLTGDVGFILE